MRKDSKEKANDVQLLLRLEVRDAQGRLISNTGNIKSKSFVIQWLEGVYSIFRGIAFNATDINNAETEINNGGGYGLSSCLWIQAGVDNGTYGIVIGTGTNAVTNTDYRLQTKIAQGAGAGQMSHGAMIFVTTAIVGANVDFVTKRTFTNNSGAQITVNEAGTYTYNAGHVAHPVHCIIRDKLAVGVDVPDKCSLTVYYTWRTTV